MPIKGKQQGYTQKKRRKEKRGAPHRSRTGPTYARPKPGGAEEKKGELDKQTMHHSSGRQGKEGIKNERDRDGKMRPGQRFFSPRSTREKKEGTCG